MPEPTTALPRLRRRPLPPIDGWGDAFHPVVARVLAARGLEGPKATQLRLRALLDPSGLGGIDAAVALLIRALDEDWAIRVVGDFDCDGATGTAVAVRGLRMLGAMRVDFDVPHRMRHGYGLSRALVESWDEPLPQLVLTVDNGISSLDGVRAARERGMQVLVTDHHVPGTELPAADAIVNPNLPGDGFPSKNLAGVGVVFYLLLALRAALRARGRFTREDQPDLTALLDLVALGTVADLVPLDRNNRILVAAGLERIRRGRCCMGLRALAEVTGRELARLNSADLGYVLGPRINAAGRLEDMRLGIRCLLADDWDEARRAAEMLDAINRERRARQQAMLDEAEAALEDGDAGIVQGEVGLSLFSPDWHAGVVGLVATKMKERLHRPVVAFAPADEAAEGDWLRGSARSIDGFHLRDALAELAVREPGLIARFGGHAMAAGLSLRRDDLARFAASFDAIARARLDATLLRAEVLSDGELAPDEITRELAEALLAAGPFGQGFPEPCFDGEFEVLAWRVVGSRHLKMVLRQRGYDARLHAIHFGGWDGEPPPSKVVLAYQLCLDDFGARRGVRLLVRHRWPA